MKNLFYSLVTLLLISLVRSDDTDDQQKLGPDYEDKTNETTVNVQVDQHVEPLPVNITYLILTN